MNTLAALLDEYEKSHRHPVNVIVHWIAEPLAILALMALASSVSLPIGTLLWPLLAVMLAYYGWLSLPIAATFVPVAALFILLITIIDGALGFPIWRWAAPMFGLCWCTLLVGHKIEGRVPSVFQNPNLIFVGPVWLMRRIFRKLGWRDP